MAAPNSYVIWYDAEQKTDIVKEWFEMVKEPLGDSSDLEQLRKEAKDLRENLKYSCMLKYLKRAENPGKYMTHLTATERSYRYEKYMTVLTRAENLAIVMYTDDSQGRPFYREFNRACAKRNWKPYRVYTTILMSAFRKLLQYEPMRDSDRIVLYRGITSKLQDKVPGQLFFKTFTSTSLSEETARRFAGADGTVLEFHPPASCHAVPIWKLSCIPEEYEVILLPFEAFDYRGSGRFVKSEHQEFLKDFVPPMPQLTDSLPVCSHVKWPLMEDEDKDEKLTGPPNDTNYKRYRHIADNVPRR